MSVALANVSLKSNHSYFSVNCTQQTSKKDSQKGGTKTAEHELESLTDSTTNGVSVGK